MADAALVIIILAREFIVTSIRLVAAGGGKVIAANLWGKAKTVSQIFAILLVLALQAVNSATGYVYLELSGGSASRLCAFVRLSH